MPKHTDKKETPLERKLKEVEREKRRVEDELKALNKAVKKGQLPNPGATAAPRVPPGRPPSATQPDVPPTPEGEPEKITPVTTPGIRRAPVHGDERFANYFSTGGFKTPLTAKRAGPSVERNKTVFIVIMFLLVAYIIYAAFF